MTRTLHVRATLALIGAFGGISAPAGIAATSDARSAAKCGKWTVVDNPDVGPDDSALVGVDALTTADVWAVGSFGQFAHERTLAEHWDGSSWKVVKTPNPTRVSTDGNVLNGVDARAPDDVWAVGTHFGNGHTSTKPLIIHWDGTRWKVVPNPPGRLSGGFLRGVAAISTDDVWAVGARPFGAPSESDPLVIHWDGTAWKIVRAPNPDGVEADFLASVTAVAASDVWAVGQADEATPFVIHYDGTKWRSFKAANPDGGGAALTGAVARSATDVWAVGASSSTSGSFSEHWDGKSWSLVDMQHKPQFDRVDAVAAVPGSDELWAVGQNQTPMTTYLTFAEHFDGTAWTTSATPSPGDASRFLGVAAAGSDVWAVGATASDTTSVAHVLIEHRC